MRRYSYFFTKFLSATTMTSIYVCLCIHRVSSQAAEACLEQIYGVVLNILTV